MQAPKIIPTRLIQNRKVFKQVANLLVSDKITLRHVQRMHPDSQLLYDWIMENADMPGFGSYTGPEITNTTKLWILREIIEGLIPLVTQPDTGYMNQFRHARTMHLMSSCIGFLQDDQMQMPLKESWDRFVGMTPAQNPRGVLSFRRVAHVCMNIGVVSHVDLHGILVSNAQMSPNRVQKQNNLHCRMRDATNKTWLWACLTPHLPLPVAPIYYKGQRL